MKKSKQADPAATAVVVSAMREGQLGNVKGLAATADLEEVLRVAAQEGRTQACEQMIEWGALPNDAPRQRRFSPLCLAAAFNHAETCRALVRLGADVDRECGKQKERSTPLMDAMLCSSHDSAAALLELGANANLASSSGVHPLAIAAARGMLRMARMLLDHGADPNKVSGKEGNRPLHLAGHDKELMLLLLDRGADAGARNKHGKTPRECALDRDFPYSAELIDSWLARREALSAISEAHQLPSERQRRPERAKP